MEVDINNPKSIKYHVAKYLEANESQFTGKLVVDIPAGSGTTTRLLLRLGAHVKAFDLFPEYFEVKGVSCERADITSSIPLQNDAADWVICQEGIEHFSDQLKTLKEINRITKKGGRVIITTPSYSNLAARLSYLLFESEHNRKMPPNEIDDIWMADKAITSEVYYGHIFLVGNQKIRILGKLAGFNVVEFKYVRLSKGSLFLFPFFYPFILITSLVRFFTNVKKNPSISLEFKKEVYSEQISINISPLNLLNKHTFVILEKTGNAGDVDFTGTNVVKSFGFH
jgi:SAM-dependent methyltransferase